MKEPAREQANVAITSFVEDWLSDSGEKLIESIIDYEILGKIPSLKWKMLESSAGQNVEQLIIWYFIIISFPYRQYLRDKGRVQEEKEEQNGRKYNNKGLALAV